MHHAEWIVMTLARLDSERHLAFFNRLELESEQEKRSDEDSPDKKAKRDNDRTE
jgi:hypothetical protein